MVFKQLQLPFERERRCGIAAYLAIGLLYTAIYLKDWASQWLSGSVAMGGLALGLFIGAVELFLLGGGNIARPNTTKLTVLILFSLAWVLTLTGKGVANMSSYYIAIPCALIITSLNPNFFFRIILVHLALTLAIEIIEYFSGEYLFIYQANDGTELDESLFGGSLDIFRAKGMFQGPLSAVAFALWVAFLTRGSTFLAAVLFLCAFFASGRLGMLISIVILAKRFFGKGGNKFSRSQPWVLLMLLVAGTLLAFSDENRLLFMSSALDVGNDQNISRIYFWITSLSYYLSYGPIDLMLGNYGFILQQESGTENDFLRLLLDCGIAGFVIYSGAISALIIRSIKIKDSEDLLISVLVVVLMNIFPFIQSLSSALLFWIYFFSRMDRPLVRRSKWI
jgi:hypothetical protein